LQSPFKKHTPNTFDLVKKSTPVSAIFLLIGISILVAGSFLTAFLWSVKNGQYDDDYTPSVRMLFDDELTPDTTSTTETKIQNK